MLLSNSLFLDKEYKNDVESKINYIELINNEDKALSSLSNKPSDTYFFRRVFVNSTGEVIYKLLGKTKESSD